ncbi:MAG: carcinine hydrolase/isopenicillin-N N-acyltransferase family protein [Candidatus Hodarchaeales archaeon]|jgi:penicillin V acylase-like amidase (Ntn superfamily)
MLIRRKTKLLLLLVAIFTILGLTVEPASACSIITASSQNSAFFGYNEDDSEADANIHDLYVVFSPENTSYCHKEVTESYGHMFVMWRTVTNFGPRVGMNAEGLAISGNGLPEYQMNPHPEKLYGRVGDQYSIYNKILEECATVSEAIALALEFDFSPVMDYQIHIADASGDAVVISPGADGEVVFIRKGTISYLISTNINRADLANREYDCPRYEKAQTELERMDPEAEVNLEDIRSILDTIHFEGFETNTVYSQVFDLKHRISYLYYWHQYSEVVSLNLTQELTKGAHQIPLLELFSQDAIDNGAQEFQTYETIVLGITIIVIVAGAAFIALVGLRVRKTLKTPSLSRKWKALQITVFLLGGAIGIGFLITFQEILSYILAGNYLSNSGNIQTIVQGVITAYLMLAVCIGILVLVYTLIRKRVFSPIIASGDP